MSTLTHLVTAEELMKLPSDRRCELVRGEIREMAPSGFDHSSISFNLGSEVRAFVKQHALGRVCGADGGFILQRNPDTVRSPDAAFMRTSRLKGNDTSKFIDGAPDLAIEVLSPSDTVEEMEEKVDEYLAAGCLLIWVVNPKRKTVTVHRPNAQPIVLRQTDTLDGGDVLPGFQCPVSVAFA